MAGKLYTVRVPEEDQEALKKAAEKLGLSASEIARRRLAEESDFEKAIKAGVDPKGKKK